MLAKCLVRVLLGLACSRLNIDKKFADPLQILESLKCEGELNWPSKKDKVLIIWNVLEPKTAMAWSSVLRVGRETLRESFKL